MTAIATKHLTPEFRLSLKRTAFDADYTPAETSRATTNFANLARGENRRANLQNALQMMTNRFNALATAGNPNGDRYSLALEIVSIELTLAGHETEAPFPLIELLATKITDHQNATTVAGMTGNSFSSYIRDYDFSVVLPQHDAALSQRPCPEDFGDVHGQIFQRVIQSPLYTQHFHKAPVICLSLACSRSYQRSGARHPILGQEYLQDRPSLTDAYFAKMGASVRFFLPEGSVAPLAFYHFGDLTADYTDLELISTIATMESFQKIYRPEIYNANAAAGLRYQPSLGHTDYSLTHITYDRDERSQLAVRQGLYAKTHLMEPHGEALAHWAAGAAA